MKMRRIVAAVLGLLSVGVPVVALGTTMGCAVGCYPQPSFKGTKSIAVTHVPSSALDVETGNGAIKVMRAGATEVAVTARVSAISQARLDATEIVAERGTDGTLKIYAVWPDGKRQPNEGVSFDVTVPDATGVRLTTSNGSIQVAGLSGAADLRTSNGSITAADHAGEVKADTSNGSIELTGVTSANAESSNGDIVVRLATGSTGPVSADSSNGSITLFVPESFQGLVECDTSNGLVTNTAAFGKPTGTPRRTHAVYQFKDGTTRSSLDTSNGSITISPLP